MSLQTQSCLVLYSFCANLLHSLIMWLKVSSLALHSVHLLFCCVLSILALVWLVVSALFCAAIRTESVSLLKFPFLSHVQVLSIKMLFIRRLKRPYYYYNYYHYYLLIRFFHTSVSWWSFTGDWVTANLLNSLGLFSVFWPSSVMLLFGWSPLGHQLPNPPVSLIIL